ncbi:hypothetical protein V1358_01505 [Pseudoalteromonas sp. YIC-656]
MEAIAIMGMTFGTLGMTFALITFSKLTRLERQLHTKGVLDKPQN